MKRRVTGTVEAILEERDGAQEIVVRITEENSPAPNPSSRRRAVALTELTGNVRMGDKVTLNTVAVELGLGTGGKDFVVAVHRTAEPDNPARGHILKLRYTPLQTPVLAVESPESPTTTFCAALTIWKNCPSCAPNCTASFPRLWPGRAGRWISTAHALPPASPTS